MPATPTADTLAQRRFIVRTCAVVGSGVRLVDGRCLTGDVRRLGQRVHVLSSTASRQCGLVFRAADIAEVLS